jgi:hypothetical protein
MKPGELIYVPAGVRLFNMSGDDGTVVEEYLQTKKPNHILVLENQKHLYKISHAGKNWYVKKNEVYEVKNDEVSKIH